MRVPETTVHGLALFPQRAPWLKLDYPLRHPPSRTSQTHPPPRQEPYQRLLPPPPWQHHPGVDHPLSPLHRPLLFRISPHKDTLRGSEPHHPSVLLPHLHLSVERRPPPLHPTELPHRYRRIGPRLPLHRPLHPTRPLHRLAVRLRLAEAPLRLHPREAPSGDHHP